MFSIILSLGLQASALAELKPVRIEEVRDLGKAGESLRVISEDGKSAILHDGNGFAIASLSDGSELPSEWLVGTTHVPPKIYTDSQVAHVPGYGSNPSKWSTTRTQPAALLNSGSWIASALTKEWLTLAIINPLERGPQPNDFGSIRHGVRGRFGPSGRVGYTKLVADAGGVSFYVPERHGGRLVIHGFKKRMGDARVTRLGTWSIPARANEWLQDLDLKRRRALLSHNGVFSLVDSSGKRLFQEAALGVFMFRGQLMKTKDRKHWLRKGNTWTQLGPFQLKATSTSETVAYFRNSITGKLYRLEF